MLRLVFDRLGTSGGLFIDLEQVKERKNENPNQIDKVPEQPGDLNSIGEMLGVLAGKISSRPAARNK